MGTLNSWAVTDANNNAAPPDGWPEGTMNYSDVNNTGRAVQGTMKRFFADVNGSLDAAGAADAYTLSLNESGYAAYFDGMMFSCSIPVTNLTTTPSIDVNGIGPVTVVDQNNNALGIGELQSGGVYDFRHDGTNLRLIGSGGVAGINTAVQYNNNGVQAGAVGLLYNNGTDELTAVNALNLTTEAVFAEQVDHTSTPGAGIGFIWLRDDGLLIYTNPSGVDVAIGTTGSTLPGGLTTELQWNNAGAFDGTDVLTWNDSTKTLTLATPGEIELQNTSGDYGLRTADEVSIQFGDASLSQKVRFKYSVAQGNWLVINGGTSYVGIKHQNNGFTRMEFPVTGGIQFTGDSLPSTNLQCLDEYEEGTFTPTLLDSTKSAAEGQTYNAQQGVYTRIGDTVFFNLRLHVNSLGTLTPGDPVYVGGLPYSVPFSGVLTSRAYAVGSTSNLALPVAGTSVIAQSTYPTEILLRKVDSTAGATNMIVSEFSAGGLIEISGHYSAVH